MRCSIVGDLVFFGGRGGDLKLMDHLPNLQINGESLRSSYLELQWRSSMQCFVVDELVVHGFDGWDMKLMDHLSNLQIRGESLRFGFQELKWSLEKLLMMMAIKRIKISLSITDLVDMYLSNRRYTKDEDPSASLNLLRNHCWCWGFLSRLPASKWRSLKVQWDEPALIPKPEKVFPWEIARAFSYLLVL